MKKRLQGPKRVFGCVQAALHQQEFVAGVGGSYGGNGMYTCKCSR